MGASSASSEQSSSILVVDDDAFARKAICFSLEGEVYTVHIAANKVVVASGFSSSETEVEAMEAVAVGIISKPFDMRLMLQEVRKAIDHSEV